MSKCKLVKDIICALISICCIAGIGIVCCSKTDEPKLDPISIIRQKNTLQGKLVVLQVDAQDTVGVKRRNLIGTKDYRAIYQHSGAVDWVVDLSAATIKGGVSNITVTLSTPRVDGITTGVHMDHFELKREWGATTISNDEKHDLREKAMSAIVKRINNFTNSSEQMSVELSDLSKGSAKLMLESFYKSIVPGSNVAIQWGGSSGEGQK